MLLSGDRIKMSILKNLTGFNSILSGLLGLVPSSSQPLENLTGFKNLLGLILIFLFYSEIQVTAQSLSGQAKITVLTCGPARPMYAMFGHTALWVNDPQNNIDEVYNFGTFDANTSHFYIKFMEGRLHYALSVVDYHSFLREYKNEKRWVIGQDLLLSNELLNDIYDSLQIANLPANRLYRYGFFKQNCSTKITDLILAFSKNVSANDSLDQPANMSYRTAIKHYLKNRPWMLFGINLLLGPFSDPEINRRQSTFLPDFLMQEIEKTGLASGPVILLDGSYQPKIQHGLTSPLVVFWIILMLLAVDVFWLKTSKSVTNGIDLAIFSLAGIFGMLFLTFWIWSEHHTLHFNFNLLWANPLLLVLPWSIPARKAKFNRVFLLLYSLLLFFFLISWSKFPQKIPMEAMPIVSILVLRAVNRVFQFRKMESTIV